MMTFSITMPIDPRLHAHNTGHWRTKAEPNRQVRQEACFLALQTHAKPLSARVVVDYRFSVPDRRRRDLANMVQSCKPICDGVVDSGLIPGDHWEVLGIGEVSVVVAKAKCVSVELIFREV